MLDCLTIIKNKNKEDLISLATSLTPTDRAYGVFGLYILSRIGNKLTESENKLIKLNQKSKAEAYSCSGCISGTRALNDLLDCKSLKWYYGWYKRTGKAILKVTAGQGLLLCWLPNKSSSFLSLFGSSFGRCNSFIFSS